MNNFLNFIPLEKRISYTEAFCLFDSYWLKLRKEYPLSIAFNNIYYRDFWSVYCKDENTPIVSRIKELQQIF